MATANIGAASLPPAAPPTTTAPGTMPEMPGMPSAPGTTTTPTTDAAQGAAGGGTAAPTGAAQAAAGAVGGGAVTAELIEVLKTLVSAIQALIAQLTASITAEGGGAPEKTPDEMPDMKGGGAAPGKEAPGKVDGESGGEVITPVQQSPVQQIAPGKPTQGGGSTDPMAGMAMPAQPAAPVVRSRCRTRTERSRLRCPRGRVPPACALGNPVRARARVAGGA